MGFPVLVRRHLYIEPVNTAVGDVIMRHKNIVAHRPHAFVSWPNLKQWLIFLFKDENKMKYKRSPYDQRRNG